MPQMKYEASFVAQQYLMNDLSFFISLRACVVHVEPSDLHILRQVSFLKLGLANTGCHSDESLTVAASLVSLPPLPVGLLPGRPASLECFGFRVSTIFVLALPMTG